MSHKYICWNTFILQISTHSTGVFASIDPFLLRGNIFYCSFITHDYLCRSMPYLTELLPPLVNCQVYFNIRFDYLMDFPKCVVRVLLNAQRLS